MKGVAIPYVIALILGIIILAIATYLIYKSMQEGTLDCQQCKAEFTAWCSGCLLAKFQGGTDLGQRRYDCVKECDFWPSASGPEQDCQNAEDACQAMGVSY